MRVFYGFLIIMVAVGLFLLPVTSATYDFRTDVAENEFRYETAGGTVANVTLLKALYDDDISTVTVTSDDTDDVPAVVAYHTSSRILDISGLDTATNRTLMVSYDFDALSASAALSNFIDYVPWIWLIMLVCFPVAAIVYLIFGMKR